MTHQGGTIEIPIGIERPLFPLLRRRPGGRAIEGEEPRACPCDSDHHESKVIQFAPPLVGEVWKGSFYPPAQTLANLHLPRHHPPMKTIYFLLACLTTLAFNTMVTAGTLKVGPNQTIKLPSQAAMLAQDGDIVEIEAGTYLKNATVWRANNLNLRGINGMARLLSQGTTVEGKGIWIIKGNNTTVENIEFADARAPDKNGAGIRLEGANLTVKNCLFRENENGILTGANPQSTVHIENSEFDHNGHGDGQSHNMYIGAIGKFTLQNSISRHANIGHQVKSRAAYNLIANNIIEDGPTGQSSYLIDLPSGGEAHIIGNTLHQGKHAENFTMVAYGAENLPHSKNSLTVTNNNFKNERRASCRLIWIKPANVTATIKNNQYTGCTRIDGNYTE